MKLVNSLWVEKYRPKILEDLILPTDYRRDFEICIKRKEISNFLFYGPPGSGKTCISLILSSKNGILERPDDNLLSLNGSAKETRGIGMVDTLIEPFLKVPPGGNDKQKIVFIDEADYLCLDGETEVKVIESGEIVSKKIEELKNRDEIQILSVNLDTNNIEEDTAIYVDSGIAEMFEVELEDGRKVICSENHPFFIMDDNGKLVEKKLRELRKNSEIVIIEEKF